MQEQCIPHIAPPPHTHTHKDTHKHPFAIFFLKGHLPHVPCTKPPFSCTPCWHVALQGAHLPRTIPTDVYSERQLSTKKYGLKSTFPEEMGNEPLATQLEQFEEWSRAPLRLDRPLAYLSCCTETFEKNLEVIQLVLGFHKNMMKVGRHQGQGGQSTH